MSELKTPYNYKLAALLSIIKYFGQPNYGLQAT